MLLVYAKAKLNLQLIDHYFKNNYLEFKTYYSKNVYCSFIPIDYHMNHGVYDNII